MAIDRRRFLKASAAQAALIGTGVGALACAGSPVTSGIPSGADPFLHGVASGDPLEDRVILWTRVSPEEGRVGEPITVDWWIASDPEGWTRLAEGQVDATPERDYTVKIDAKGLEPGTEYFYRFATWTGSSTVGRTRTLPEQNVDHLRLAVTSCSNYPAGYFNAYAAIAQRDDFDVVLHLGDYLYEYGNGEYGDGTDLGRIPDPVHETVRLDDYRRRHATYKTDPDLQAAHARHPWITVWDDHESADNAFRDGAENHDPLRGEGSWSERRLAAIRAYYEWMPIRELPTGLFRRFRFGDLADLIMLDTRLAGRDRQVRDGDHAAAWNPKRTILGAEQQADFLAALSEDQRNQVAWKVVGQQVIVSPLTDGSGRFNADTWDGYRESRRIVLDHLVEDSIEGVIFLTGDYHSSWAFEVPPPGAPHDAVSTLPPVYDPETGAGARAVEFVVPAVSSRPLGQSVPDRKSFKQAQSRLAHLKYLNLEDQGYLILDLTPERARAQWMFTHYRRKRSSEERCGGLYETELGTNRLRAVDEETCLS